MGPGILGKRCFKKVVTAMHKVDTFYQPARCHKDSFVQQQVTSYGDVIKITCIVFKGTDPQHPP